MNNVRQIRKEFMGEQNSLSLSNLKEDNFTAEIIIADTVLPIAIDLIKPCPFEPQARRRAKFKDSEIDSLGESILKHRLRQPILVRPFPDGIYEIVFGERRWLAARKKGLKTINCFVEELTDAEVIELQYEENHRRQNPDPLDDAFYFTYLQKTEGYSTLDLTIKFSLSERSVLDRLKLNDLIDEAKKELSDGILPLGHAVYLSKFPARAQKEIVDNAYAYKWNDRADGAVPLHEFKREVGENVVRLLKNAPFDPADQRLHLRGLKCSNCKERTGYEPNFFDDLTDKDSCLNKQCFESKSNVHLKLKRDAIAERMPEIQTKPIEEVAASVPLVTSRKYVDKEDIPFKETVLTNQEFLPEAECEFSKVSLIVDGERKGQSTYICRQNDCEVHHPQPKNSELNPAQLEKRQKDFDEQVRKATQREIIMLAGNSYSDYFTIWMSLDDVQNIIFRLFHSIDSNMRSAVLEYVRSWKLFPKDFSNPLVVKDAISKLSIVQQSILIHYLIRIPEGFYEMDPVDGLKELARTHTKNDFRLIEAQIRVDLAPDEFKQRAQGYLDGLRDGEDVEVPQFWTETSLEGIS